MNRIIPYAWVLSLSMLISRNTYVITCIRTLFLFMAEQGFPGGSDDKESACNARDTGFIPGLGRSPGKGNSYPLQYPGLENPMDRRIWWATVHEVTKSQI